MLTPTKATTIYAAIGRMMLGILHVLEKDYPGLDVEERLLCLGVAVGLAENRRMTSSKLALFVGLPRTTALRKVNHLIELGYLEVVSDKTLVAVGGPVTLKRTRELAEKCSRIVQNAAAELSKVDT